MNLKNKKNKKIVFFIPSIESGGVEKNLFILLNFFRKFYSEIYLVTSSKIRLSKDIKVVCFNSKILKKRNRFLKSLFCSFLLFKNFKKNDVIVISFQSNTFSLLLSKVMLWPVIIRLNTSPEKYINNILKTVIYKIFYNMANEVIVNSFEFKNNLKKILGINSSVILNPLVQKKIINKKKNSNKYKGLKILNIGRLTDQKDQITLLKSIKLLLFKHKIDCKLFIIGKGINYNKLQKYISDNKLNKNIFLLGYKKNAYQYLKQYDLFILSSKYEGLPNVLIEAQMALTPIISSNCPSGPKEILLNGKLGILFKTGDHKDLSKKILIFKNNRKKFKNKALLATKYLSRFDYETNLHKYLKIINKYKK